MRAATATGASLEKINLTVDSGASDAVLPPHMLRWVDLVHAGKVGTGYGVANGAVVRNFGEKRRLMLIGEKSHDELDIVFRVVERPQAAFSGQFHSPPGTQRYSRWGGLAHPLELGRPDPSEVSERNVRVGHFR